MYHQGELFFLRDVFHRSRVHTSLLSQKDVINNLSDIIDENLFDSFLSIKDSLSEALENIKQNTVYNLTDSFERKYLFLLLPFAEGPTVLFVGPYLAEEMSNQRLLMICEKNGIPPQRLQKLNEYFSFLPVMQTSSHLMTMFNTFCEILWKSPSFSIVDIVGKYKTSDYSVSESMQNSNPKELLANMKAMEKRYAFENKIINAVSLGQIHVEDQLFSVFSDNFFEKRVPDPIRNAKNYCIIMNTLLRKAAEKGGVHPIHLDRISSDFAVKIENLTSMSEIKNLMSQMFRNYCNLVQKHAIKKYSPVVQKTVMLIDSDLSADLSPSSLALSQSISPGYLSTVFRKETGKTLSEYVREKRMHYAAHLLSTTNLQIQTIALYCGIMDAQYFSKLFKKIMGQSPNEYRASALRS